MSMRYQQPDDLRRACKDVHAAQRKTREALYRHRAVLTIDEQNALEGCMEVLRGVEVRLNRKPAFDQDFAA